MPKRVDQPKKKKKSFFSRWTETSRRIPGDFLRGAEDAATGLPTGIVTLAQAIDQALPRSPIPGIDEDHKQDFGPLKNIGKSIVTQTKEDLRHPLRDPFSTTLTLLGIASLGSGSALRAASGVSKASKATGKASKVKSFAKGAARPRPATRKLKLADKPVGGKEGTRVMFGKPGETPKKGNYVEKGRTVEVEANPNPLARGARKITLDPMYRRSLKKADEVARGTRTKGGGYARAISRRTEDQRNRYAENIRRLKSEPDVLEENAIKNIARAPMDLMRLSMYARPRYYLQNLGGTAQLLAHAGVSAGDVKTVRQIAKNDPELYRLMVAAGGETGTKAIAMGTGTGRLGKLSRKAADVANRPEAHMRTVAIWKAAKDFGVESADELKDILKRPDSDEAQLIMTRGNEMVVDYGRIGGSGTFGKAEKAFVQSGLPIFYPMMKGFTRYASRFPTQHPVQAAGMAQLGEFGKDVQRENIGGEPQPWFPYITPLDDFETVNLQNIYAFSPGTDIYRQAAQAFPGSERHPTLNLLQALGPSAELAYGALTGRQIATGFEYDADTLDKYGPLLTALGDTAKSVVPGLEYVSPRSSAAYGDPDLQEQLMLALLGPGLYPRETDFSKIRQPKKKKPGRKRKPGKF